MPVDEFLNVKEAAELIGCTDARVRQMLLADEMKGRKATASIWLIHRSEVERIISKERRKGGRPRVGD